MATIAGADGKKRHASVKLNAADVDAVQSRKGTPLMNARRLITDITAVAVAFALAGCTSSAPALVTPRQPETTDFRIDVIVTSKQCFSATACNYHYDVDPWPTDSYPAQFDDTKVVVIYTITGGDQDLIGNFTIKGAGDLIRDTDVVVTGPNDATFTATATRVIVEN